MKHKLLALGNRISPTAVDRLRDRRNSTRGALARETSRLRDDVTLLQQRVAELTEEIDETRRDNVRLAELTDIVEHRLTDRRAD